MFRRLRLIAVAAIALAVPFASCAQPPSTASSGPTAPVTAASPTAQSAQPSGASPTVEVVTPSPIPQVSVATPSANVAGPHSPVAPESATPSGSTTESATAATPSVSPRGGAAAASPTPPPPAASLVDQTRRDAAQQAGVAVDQVSVVSVTAVSWPDSSLGCPQPGQAYSQIVTAGYKIVLSANGKTYEYHTNRGNRAVLCNPH